MRAAARPPGPGGSPLGLPFGGGRTDVANYLLDLARRYGDVVRLRLPSGGGYLLSHPDAVKDVLVTRSREVIKSRGLERAKRLLGEGLLTSESELHLRQRRLVQPAFHRDRIAEYGAVMAAYAQAAAERFQSGVRLDVSREMMRLTLAIVGKTLFDAEVESAADEVSEALTAMQHLLPASLLPFSELFDRVPLPSNVRFWRARARLDAVIYRIIAARRDAGDRGDLLSMLLAARDAEGDGRGMSDEQVRDECMTLLLAGHETTAQLLTWTWYLLSRHPQAEARLHQEIDARIGGRIPRVDDLPALEYVHATLKESMRLYPPAWLIGRRVLHPFAVGDYVMPARSIVLISPFVIQRDARWYRDPDRFDPQRWLGAEPPPPPKYAYIPFGGGPRVCIGEQFAWMEAALVLVTIARRWRLAVPADYDPELLPLITLRPKHGMPAIPHPRTPLSSRPM